MLTLALISSSVASRTRSSRRCAWTRIRSASTRSWSSARARAASSASRSTFSSSLLDALLGFAADVLGALHHPLLDLGLQPHRGLVRLGRGGFGVGGALLGGGDPSVGLGLNLLPRLLDLDLDLDLRGLERLGDGALGRGFASAAARSASERACAVVATISSRSACARCCSSSKAFSARSRAASAPATRALGLGARLALGGDPLAGLGGDLAQRQHRPLLQLGLDRLGPRLGRGDPLLADPDPLERLVGDAAHRHASPHRPAAAAYGSPIPAQPTTGAGSARHAGAVPAEDRQFADACPPTPHAGLSDASRARRSCFSTLPVALRGSSSRNSTSRGVL